MLENRHAKAFVAALFNLALGTVSVASTAHAQASTCGDGIVEGDESCDGQVGCDATCSPLENWECTPDLVANTAVCVEVEGWSCDPIDPTICAPICGDGFVRGDEECDDGALDNDDGCSDICTVDAGWSCAGEPSVCTEDTGAPPPVCGDGVLDDGEACDDGNTDDGDGCSSACAVEASWTCTGEPSTCTEDTGAPPPVCGDGILDDGEACDDGNTDDGDGCSSACAVEANWTCTGEPSTCTEDDDEPIVIEPVCGDGAVDIDEACDDGNTDDGDGCSSTCAVETGWSCSGEPSTCIVVDHPPMCGNGFVEAGEACDGQPGCTDNCNWRANMTGGRIGSCASASSAGGMLAALLMLLALTAARRRERS